eukprot:4139709-Prymnesium_polylepis.1
MASPRGYAEPAPRASITNHYSADSVEAVPGGGGWGGNGSNGDDGGAHLSKALRWSTTGKLLGDKAKAEAELSDARRVHVQELQQLQLRMRKQRNRLVRARGNARGAGEGAVCERHEREGDKGAPHAPATRAHARAHGTGAATNSRLPRRPPLGRACDRHGGCVRPHFRPRAFADGRGGDDRSRDALGHCGERGDDRAAARRADAPVL